MEKMESSSTERTEELDLEGLKREYTGLSIQYAKAREAFDKAVQERTAGSNPKLMTNEGFSNLIGKLNATAEKLKEAGLSEGEIDSLGDLTSGE